MLEHVSAIQARIDEIRSRFRTDGGSGVVNVAPHTSSAGMTRPGEVKPFFPQYLLRELQGQPEAEATPAAYDEIIRSAANKYNVDEALVRAVIKAESNFRPNAVSRAGAQGLMQLMPATSAGLGVTDPFDPSQNINGGARYLKGQLERFGGDVKLALAAYNAGPGAVARYGGVPPFKETQNYVQNVLAYIEDYKR